MPYKLFTVHREEQNEKQYIVSLCVLCVLCGPSLVIARLIEQSRVVHQDRGKAGVISIQAGAFHRQRLLVKLFRPVEITVELANAGKQRE